VQQDSRIDPPVLLVLTFQVKLDRKETIYENTLKYTKKFPDISSCFVDRLMPAPYEWLLRNKLGHV